MIKLILTSILLLGLIVWAGLEKLDDAKAEITRLQLNNQNLVDAATANEFTIELLSTDLAHERAINQSRAAETAKRNKKTLEKVIHVKRQNQKGWYGDSLPVSAVCLLTDKAEGSVGAKGDLCEEGATSGVVEADPSTEVKNEDHATLTLELQSALDSCNADKADVSKWIREG